MAYALGQIWPGGPGGRPRIVCGGRTGSMEVRQYSVDALGRIGPDAAEGVAKIVESLQSPLNDEHVHRLAARALGRIGPAAAAAVEPLVEMLRDKDLVLQVEAAVALWKIAQHKAALPAVVKVMGREETEGPYQAVMAIPEFSSAGTPATSALVQTLDTGRPTCSGRPLRCWQGLESRCWIRSPKC